eukprot:CAMPEP_0171299416 /NCGR_PEP_ID=MMETSP0816-20121228/8238_1 /TAXON_ID=420281 /ORGANISM="Proboscia inermis, Strain CCAP1064/1" /LENGTH=418 /DNA_ID=CAMNT_0011775199 /DNA_START=197 /DNA_END=1453 /DNA_ORIENTATION=+
MLAHNDNDDGKDMSKRGICFHWDKDEDLRLLTDGQLYVHPHVSTVTYLTDIGSPTMVVENAVVDISTGKLREEPQGNLLLKKSAFLSWPRRNKHLSFDGRFLHAAPSDLMEEGVFERQTTATVVSHCSTTTNENDDCKDAMIMHNQKQLERRCRRVTLLVNVWLNYRPYNVNPFPSTMLDKLSKVHDILPPLDDNRNGEVNNKHDLFEGVLSEPNDTMGKTQHQNLPCSAETVLVSGEMKKQLCDNGQQQKLHLFEWPMGGIGKSDDGTIQMQVPLTKVREQMEEGDGNIILSWDKETKIRFCGASEEELSSFTIRSTTETNAVLDEKNVDLEQTLSVGDDSSAAIVEAAPEISRVKDKLNSEKEIVLTRDDSQTQQQQREFIMSTRKLEDTIVTTDVAPMEPNDCSKRLRLSSDKVT